MGGQAYVYRVRGVNAVGGGQWAVAKCSGRNDRAPDAPELTATVISTSEILLSWTKPNGNGTDIDGYEVRQWNPDVQPTQGFSSH